MGKSVRAALAALAACWLPLGARGGEVLEIPMSVAEPAGIERKPARICGGIPLPKGAFGKGQPFAVFDADGREIPSQVLPLVVDADGTARWVLVDFADDVAAGATHRYVLRAISPKAAPASRVRVSSDRSQVAVDTGKITFTISKAQPFGLVSSVVAGGSKRVAGGKVRYTDGFDGKTYLAAAPASVEVVYSGPMRATICARGRFTGDEKNRFQYVAWITAWAGSSAVHVKYSLANSNPDHYCYRTVRESAIELVLAEEPSGSLLGAGEPVEAAAAACVVQTLRSRAPGAARATSGDRELWVSKGAGDEAQGWIAAKLGPVAVYACDLYFADDPARRLALRGRSLILSGVIERPQGQAADKASPYADTRRCIYDCSHLSSQYLIDFHAAAEPARLARLARAARNRLWLFATPAWYLDAAEAMPLGKFGTQADELACYQTWGWKFDKKDIPSRPARRYPRFHPGTDNHYRPEEDPLDQLLIMYLRTGARSYFDNARSWANYWMDLYAWRTDGWRHRDGGVWWYSGPKGNRPQRLADPLTKARNHIPAPWSKKLKAPWTMELVRDNYFLANSKSCYCHNWGQGLLAWFCLTGDRDALEAAIDRVEQDYDTQRRARARVPGKSDDFSRGFNRASYLAHAARMLLPEDEAVREASEFLARVYLARPTKEPRGLVNGARPWRRGSLQGGLGNWVGQRGVEELKKLGHQFDPDTGRMTDPKTGRSWYVLQNPHTWMFPPLSRAMELYHRLTGNEDAMDWTIAYGQAAARVLYQEHGLLTYGKMLVDFPARGVARDYASWAAPEGSRHAEGLVMSGYLARFHPDVCARAYSLCGEALLKQRAYDYWRAGSHRGYRRKQMSPLDRVGMWVNYHSDHDGQTDFVGRTFHIWAHPRTDQTPPDAIGDLKVTVAGAAAQVTFTAPADNGGAVARYQLKCSDRPIVEYQRFLELFNGFQEAEHCNWWMAANLDGEPAPQAPGRKESFTVTGLPAGAEYFAVRSFDVSSNRSALSNVCRAAR